MEQGFKIKDATRQRCKIVKLDAKGLQRFTPLSLELFHFLYQARTIDFSLYFRIGNTLIEYIRPHELSQELLGEMWEAMQRPRDGLEICVLKGDRSRFDILIDQIRSAKISAVLRHMPQADKKTLDLFAHLSSVSQRIVSGGIDASVVDQVKAAASYMVSNVIDSDSAISTLSRMIICDPTLYDHSATVAMISSVIAQRLVPTAFGVKDCELLSQCALYHDVGKTCVPNAVLNKPGRLTPEEFEIMKQHTTFGYDELHKLIEAGAGIEEIIARVALEHHEKWDGSGYPHGRKGAAEVDHDHGIHLFTRVVTIADIYSALLMKRVYKPAFEPQDAIKIMASESPGFDPKIFMPFLKGVVSSLNTEQAKTKDKGRILVFDSNGTLNEWKPDEKKASGT